jgi:hypothetical protein
MTQQHFFSSAAGGDVITAASGVGGLIYLVISKDTNLGLIDVTFGGVIRAPLFVKGQTTEADWRSTIRNHPAPFGEIATSKFIMTMQSSYLANVDNPQQIAGASERAVELEISAPVESIYPQPMQLCILRWVCFGTLLSDRQSAHASRWFLTAINPS